MIGLIRLLHRHRSLLGLAKGTRIPWPICSARRNPCSMVLLMASETLSVSNGGAYLSSYPGVSSGSHAVSFCSNLNAVRIVEIGACSAPRRVLSSIAGPSEAFSAYHMATTAAFCCGSADARPSLSVTQIGRYGRCFLNFLAAL